MERFEQQQDLVPVPSSLCRLQPGRTLRDVAAVIFRRQRIILTLFVSLFGIAAVAVVGVRPRLDPPQWTAGLRFLVRRDRVDPVVTPSDRPPPGPPAAVTPQEVLAEIELVKSADVVEQVAREAGAPLERLQQGLAAEPVASGRNTTNLIAVRYSSPDRAEVVRVLSKLPEVYLQKYLSVNRRPGVVEYFRSQAEVHEGQLREAEEELTGFEKDLPALAVEGKESERPRADAEAGLRDAESRAVELERQLSKTPLSLTRVREAEESPYLGRLKNQLLELENRRAQATRYREIVPMEARIADLGRRIAAETRGPTEESVVNPARAQLEAEARRWQVELAGLRARGAVLAGEERRRREQAAAARLITAENSVQLAELRRQVKAAEEIFLLYRKKYAEAREAELLDRNRVLNVSLAESPRAPTRVEKRSLAFYLGWSWVLALAISMAAGFATDLLDHSIHTPRELEDCSSLVVLACIPESRKG